MWKAELQKKQYNLTFTVEVYISTTINTSSSVLSTKKMM